MLSDDFLGALSGEFFRARLPLISDAQQLRTVITQIIAKGYVFEENSQKKTTYGSKRKVYHFGCRIICTTLGNMQIRSEALIFYIGRLGTRCLCRPPPLCRPPLVVSPGPPNVVRSTTFSVSSLA